MSDNRFTEQEFLEPVQEETRNSLRVSLLIAIVVLFCFLFSCVAHPLSEREIPPEAESFIYDAGE